MLSQNRGEELAENLLSNLLKGLNENVFIKSTDSVSGEEEHLTPVIEDMEAVIAISGEWDREDLKKVLLTLLDKELETSYADGLGKGKYLAERRLVKSELEKYKEEVMKTEIAYWTNIFDNPPKRDREYPCDNCTKNICRIEIERLSNNYLTL